MANHRQFNEPRFKVHIGADWRGLSRDLRGR